MAKNFQTFLLDEIFDKSRIYLENKYSSAILEDEAELKLEELVNDAIGNIDDLLLSYCSKIDDIVKEQNDIYFGDKDYIERGLVNYE